MRIRSLVGAAVVVAVSTQGQSKTFCERMAAQTGMTSKYKADTASPPIWSMHVFNVAQRFMVGGSAVVVMSIKAVASESAADHPDPLNSCGPSGKKLVCTIAGPSTFVLTLNGKETDVVSKVGEKAQVTAYGSRVECTNR